MEYLEIIQLEKEIIELTKKLKLVNSNPIVLTWQERRDMYGTLYINSISLTNQLISFSEKLKTQFDFS